MDDEIAPPERPLIASEFQHIYKDGAIPAPFGAFSVRYRFQTGTNATPPPTEVAPNSRYFQAANHKDAGIEGNAKKYPLR